MGRAFTARGFAPTCGNCDAIVSPDANRCQDCGQRVGLTPKRIEDVGAAALSLQHSAGMLRDLTNGGPHGQPRGKRYVALRDMTRELEDVRRRLLELWS